MQKEDMMKEDKDYFNNLFFNNMFTGLPARITKVYSDNAQLIEEVQPLNKDTWLIDDEEQKHNLPPINNVPFSGTFEFGDMCITFPFAVGDLVWLTGSDISLDDLLELDPKEPIDIREYSKWGLSNMVAIGSFPTKLRKIDNVDRESITIRTKDNSTYIKIKKNGEIVNKGVLLVGDDTASKALALAEKVNSNFIKLQQWAALANTPMGIYGIPPAPVTYDDTSSNKVFTND